MSRFISPDESPTPRAARVLLRPHPRRAQYRTRAVTTPPAQPRRVLHALDATLITVGAMVGSGIFQTPADIARRVGNTSAALTVWALGGALSLLGVLAVAELGAAYPDSGGLYVHLRRAFGPGVAFLLGWTLLTVLLPSSVAYFSLVTAGHRAPPRPSERPTRPRRRAPRRDRGGGTAASRPGSRAAPDPAVIKTARRRAGQPWPR
jgi:hypothetical protein